MAFSIFVINISRIAKTWYRIVMQDKIYKVKIFEVTHKSVKSMKVFSLEIFKLYGTTNVFPQTTIFTLIVKKFSDSKVLPYCSSTMALIPY